MLIYDLKVVQDRVQTAMQRCGRQGEINIIAVTKTHPFSTIVDCYNAGIRSIGENRIQEAFAKFPELPALEGLEKRMIGHLQSNKINRCLDLFDTVDTVDSLRLAKKISRRLENTQRTLPVLLEINTSGEQAKSGFDPENTEAMLACIDAPQLHVQGLMTVGPLTSNRDEIRLAFQRLAALKESLNRQIDTPKKLTELSMGMSGDYEIAIEEGSTMIRLGTALLGNRKPYPPTS